MLIWSHADAGCLHIALLYVLFGIVPLIGLGLYFFKCYLPAVRDPDNRNWLARMLLSIPIALILVVEIFALRLPMSIVELHRAERHTLRGQVELVSYAEDWGRSFNGYTVVLSVDGTEFTCVDAFPKEILDRLSEGGPMEITYVELGNDGTYVWEIKSIP